MTEEELKEKEKTVEAQLQALNGLKMSFEAARDSYLRLTAHYYQRLHKHNIFFTIVSVLFVAVECLAAIGAWVTGNVFLGFLHTAMIIWWVFFTVRCWRDSAKTQEKL